jgi:polyisoprenyl-teichoic acid--peptidoglycan teichoic acid transferase
MPNAYISAPRKNKGTRSLLLLFLLLVIGTGAAALGAIAALLAPVEPPIITKTLGSVGFDDVVVKPPEYTLTRPVNILVMGIDQVPKASPYSSALFEGRSDTMLLVRFNPDDKSISVLSIPRDTEVDIPEIGLTKINEANVKGGAKLAAKVVSKTLQNIPIDRYVRVSTGAFRELVDLLGGVDVFVSRPMSYMDKTQKFQINLVQGWQTLNGEKAEEFSRFRDEQTGDLGRIQRQQILMQSLRERLTNPNIITMIPLMIHVMQKYVDTNCNFDEILTLTNLGLSVEREQVKMVMLPGEQGSSSRGDTRSFWFVDSEGRDRILAQYFNLFYGNDNPRARSREAQAKLSRAYPKDLKIVIQNASSNPKISNKVAAYLGKKGFDKVVVQEPWPARVLPTQIIVEKGDVKAANILKETLNGGNIEASSTGVLDSDITIRIGEDWVNKF